MPSPAHFEIPAEMRAFVERSLEQAKLAFDKFMDAAQSTMNTFEGQSKVAQASAKEVTQKIKDFAEQNVAATPVDPVPNYIPSWEAPEANPTLAKRYPDGRPTAAAAQSRRQRPAAR